MSAELLDTVIAGGGVAGLTAGLFAARLGLSSLVLVADIPGGHLANVDRVHDFPGFLDGIAGYDLGPTIQEQAAQAGAAFQMAEALSLAPLDGGWRLGTTDGDVEGRTVIVAAGSRSRSLGVPGEERLRGRGISTCASCDGPFLEGKPAIVVGGGDSAFQEALTLAGFASEVLIVHDSELPTAQEVYRRGVRDHARIRVQGNIVVDEILGETVVEAVRLRDSAGGATSLIETAGVFVYIGLEPNTAFLRGVLRLDVGGRVPTDVWMRTELAGVFAAGDIRSDSGSQAVTAAGDGASAAIAAHRYLREL